MLYIRRSPTPLLSHATQPSKFWNLEHSIGVPDLLPSPLPSFRDTTFKQPPPGMARVLTPGLNQSLMISLNNSDVNTTTTSTEVSRVGEPSVSVSGVLAPAFRGRPSSSTSGSPRVSRKRSSSAPPRSNIFHLTEGVGMTLSEVSKFTVPSSSGSSNSSTVTSTGASTQHSSQPNISRWAKKSLADFIADRAGGHSANQSHLMRNSWGDGGVLLRSSPNIQPPQKPVTSLRKLVVNKGCSASIQSPFAINYG